MANREALLERGVFFICSLPFVVNDKNHLLMRQKPSPVESYQIAFGAEQNEKIKSITAENDFAKILVKTPQQGFKENNLPLPDML